MVILEAGVPFKTGARTSLDKQATTKTSGTVAAEVHIAETRAGVTDKHATTKHTGAVLGKAAVVDINVGTALYAHTTTGAIAGTATLICGSCGAIKANAHIAICTIATEIHTANATTTSTRSINTTTVFSAVTFKLTTTQVKA